MARSKSGPEVIEASATVIEDAMAPLTESGRWLASVRERVGREVEDYGVFDVTDEATYKQAKKNRGYLNGVVKTINAERVDKLSAIRRAIDLLGEETNAATKPLSEIAGALDERCKAWEAQVVADRLAMLREAYEDAAPFIALPPEGHDEPLVPFERVLEHYGRGQLGKKWELYGTKDADALDQLEKAVGQVAEAEKNIDAMVAEADRDEVKALYFSTLDANSALGKARELAEQRERVLRLEAERREREEAQRRAEEERIAAEEAARLAAEAEREARQAASAPASEEAAAEAPETAPQPAPAPPAPVPVSAPVPEGMVGYDEYLAMCEELGETPRVFRDNADPAVVSEYVFAGYGTREQAEAFAEWCAKAGVSRHIEQPTNGRSYVLRPKGV